MKKSIITIGRQYGCGGREIGLALSKKLGIPFYDRELIDYAAQSSGIDSNVLEQYDEKATNSLLYSLSLGSYMVSAVNQVSHLPINDQLYISQSEIINKLADQGSCIILGRCSDYVLKDRDNVLKVFLYCDDELRVQNIMNRFGITKNKATEIVKKTDKRRASYYSYYTHQKWGVISNFDLAINCKIGTDKVVNMIASRYDDED